MWKVQCLNARKHKRCIKFCLSISKTIRLGTELADIKKSRATLEASLKNRKAENSKLQQSGRWWWVQIKTLLPNCGYREITHLVIQPTIWLCDNTHGSSPPAALPSAALDPKVASLALQLEKLDEDLAKEEESILNRLRAPLSRTDPAGDLAKRLKEQEVRGLTTVSLRHHHLQTHHRVISWKASHLSAVMK